jgi:hypothetical protein
MREEITKKTEIRCRMINEVPSGDYAVAFRQTFVCSAADKCLSAALLTPKYSKTEPPEYSLTAKLAFSLHGITRHILYHIASNLSFKESSQAHLKYSLRPN